VGSPGAEAGDREIAPVSEEIDVASAEVEGFVGHVELETAIPPLREQRLGHGEQARGLALLQLGQVCSPGEEIHRAPIVRVDETVVPELCPLVKIGDTGRGDLEEGLRQGIEETNRRQPGLEALEVSQKARRGARR